MFTKRIYRSEKGKERQWGWVEGGKEKEERRKKRKRNMVEEVSEGGLRGKRRRRKKKNGGRGQWGWGLNEINLGLIHQVMC